ncbi:MAG: AAA family ATPase [Bacteroidota bacterium]
MKVIGITGTIGAGKGTIVEYLTSKKGFLHYSVRAFLVKELEKRNLPVNRDTMTELANTLRKENSPSFITDSLYNQAKKAGKSAVIESIRTPGEIDSLKSKGDFLLFAVDARPEIRYKRILERKSETDTISWETFLDNEKREMTATDPHKQNIHKCIEQADYVFNNDSSIENLYKDLEKVLERESLK